jgi:hypothetical protein
MHQQLDLMWGLGDKGLCFVDVWIICGHRTFKAARPMVPTPGAGSCVVQAGANVNRANTLAVQVLSSEFAPHGADFEGQTVVLKNSRVLCRGRMHLL